MVKGTTCYSMPSAELAVGVYDPPRDVYAITPHEITHVIAYWTVGVGTQDMLIEGLAVATTGSYWANMSVHAAAARLLQERKLRPLDVMFDNQAWLKVSDEDDGVYYNQAGSFVQYLIDTRGNERFRQLYNRASEPEYAAAFQEIYGTPIGAFYAEWLDFLTRGA